jgi:SNF family Na+-dependent transporter
MKGALARVLATFGSVPLFVYIIHLPIAHLTAVLIAYIGYGKVFSWLDLRTAPAGYAPHLWLTYLVWFCLIILIFPLAKWFSALKKRKKARWLSYL